MQTGSRKERDFIRENFGEIWPVHVSAFTRLLTQFRARFDGDLDLLLVLAVIGERTRPENWNPQLVSLEDLATRAEDRRSQYAINIQSIADYSGIPRETVRRKVLVLQRKGWVHRSDGGKLSISADAAPDLAVATGDTIAYLQKIFCAFENARDTGNGAAAIE
ncbi:hypothetical protein BMG03_04585 [Thioclava nitratireducens]|uniref:HTH crp-type domain-containing protein n=1 Tax=Thioclava nitratireducens TaxID=1915078 RepID=A0ABM6IES2_9RHOB|nr:hypothetical protein [Thioclava nitratireducens]AQS47153.1 hypothetical protein BMG03_04585 [Thioclava nitratireducens]